MTRSSSGPAGMALACAVVMGAATLPGCGATAERQLSAPAERTTKSTATTDSAGVAPQPVGGPTLRLPTTLTPPSLSPPTTALTQLVVPTASGEPTICRIEITVVADHVGFEFDSAELTEQNEPLLDEIASRITGAQRLEIRGHTSSEGDRAYNIELSKRRADTVATAIAARSTSLPAPTIEGVGPDQPIADNATEQGRRTNRRVQIIADVPAEQC